MDSQAPDAMSTVASTSRSGPHLDLLPIPILHLLSLHPFTSLPQAVLPLLTSVLHHYLSLIASTSAKSAAHCGRSALIPQDVVHSIESIGAASIKELTGWVKSEERADWLDRCDKGWSSSRAKEEEESRRRSWRSKIAAGRPTTQTIQMKYIDVSLEEAEEYEQLRVIEEGRRHSCKRKRSQADHLHQRSRSLSSGSESAWEDGVSDSDDESIGSPRTSRTTPSPPVQLLPADATTYQQRSLPISYSQDGDASRIDYVPHFLPPFPELNNQKTSERKAGKAKAELAIRSATGDALDQLNLSEGLSEPTATATSYFKPATSWAQPEATTSEQALAALPKPFKPARSSTSSLPSFIETYTSLLSEPQAALPASSARRSLAQSLANPSAYCPVDTLYGGLCAKPSSTPFVPSASHLITLPTRGTGAPRFTPTRPKGRPISAMPDGASTPLLGYRQPAKVLGNLAQRFLASAPLPSYNPVTEAIDPVTNLPQSIDGSNYAPPLSTLHRSLHLFDPEPLRDREHVEQVYRGVAMGPSTSSDRDNPLLRGEHWLKGAVDAVQTLDAATTAAAGGSGGQEKVKSGTMVYTWDWTNQEYAGQVVGGHNYGKEGNKSSGGQSSSGPA